MNAAAGIELRPLDTDAVSSYLTASASGPTGAARWDPVITALRTPGPVAQALSTPLMAGLAQVIYNPHPGGSLATLPDPAKLCALAHRAAIEGHLLDAFIPPSTALSPASPHGTPGGPRRKPRHGSASLPTTLNTPSTAPTWPGGNSPEQPPARWPGPRSGSHSGSRNKPPMTFSRYRSSPRSALREARFATLMLGFMVALTGTGSGMLVGSYLGGGLAGSLAGLLTAELMILLFGDESTFPEAITAAVWPQLLMARGPLARHGRLPRRLLAFLADACQRGVLRQAGPVYQFRHAELQQRLASRHNPAQI